MRFLKIAALAGCVLAIGAFGSAFNANAAGECDEGEIVIKFFHLTNTDKHPK